MKSYRLKPPTFEARQFTGKPSCIVNGFFAWLGEGAKVIAASDKEARVSVMLYGKDTELNVGDWVISGTNQGFASRNVISDEDFKRDFEVKE